MFDVSLVRLQYVFLGGTDTRVLVSFQASRPGYGRSVSGHLNVVLPALGSGNHDRRRHSEVGKDREPFDGLFDGLHLIGAGWLVPA
jgi:hypothetical protein